MRTETHNLLFGLTAAVLYWLGLFVTLWQSPRFLVHNGAVTYHVSDMEFLVFHPAGWAIFLLLSTCIVGKAREREAIRYAPQTQRA